MSYKKTVKQRTSVSGSVVRDKNKEFEELERDYKELGELVNQVRKAAASPTNFSPRLVLDILNRRG